MTTEELLGLIRERAKERILYLPHAIVQMSRKDRMISTKDVRSAIFSGEVIEDYPDDVRGHSCLMLGRTEDNRAIHVVCAPEDSYLAVITAYVPTETQWESGFRKRKKD